MSKASKKREIVTLDPSTKRLYKLSDNILSEITVKERSSSAYNISYMPGLDVMYASVEIPSDSEEDEVSIITNKAYETLELDIDKDYKISYSISNASVGMNTIYNVFVVDSERIETEFKDVANKIQYIDYIDMEPLMYQNYYHSKIIDQIGTQVFIYFHKTYATLTLYKDGELINFKIVNKLSIDMLHAAYCHDLAERIPVHMFIDELNKYGFDHIDDAKRVSLNKILSESFNFLKNNLSLMLRAAQLENETITKVIVGTDLGLTQNFVRKIEILFSSFRSLDPDLALENLLANEITSSSDSLLVSEFINMHKLKYDLFKNIKNFTVEVSSQNNFTTMSEKDCSELKINPFVLLGFLRAHEQLKLANDVFNISPYLRPPPFSKRYSGKLILSAIAVVILASIYPTYNYIVGYLASEQNYKLEDEIAIQDREYKKVKSEIENLQNNIKNLQSQLNDSQSKLDYRYAILNNIYDKKVNYKSKVKILAEISEVLNEAKIKVTKVDIISDRLQLALKGSTAAITDFLKLVGSNPIYQIESKEVLIKTLNKDDKNKEYESNVTIRVVI